MTAIKVKKGDVEMLKAFLNQCEGEIIATKRRRNERAGRHECQQQPPSADVAPQEPGHVETQTMQTADCRVQTVQTVQTVQNMQTECFFLLYLNFSC